MATNGQPYVGNAAPPPEIQEIVSHVLASGGSLDDAAKAALARTRSPIVVIKALRNARPGLSLAEAKPIIHRNLAPAAQAAAERLWDDVERGLGEGLG